SHLWKPHRLYLFFGDLCYARNERDCNLLFRARIFSHRELLIVTAPSSPNAYAHNNLPNVIAFLEISKPCVVSLIILQIRNEQQQEPLSDRKQTSEMIQRSEIS